MPIAEVITAVEEVGKSYIEKYPQPGYGFFHSNQNHARELIAIREKMEKLAGKELKDVSDLHQEELLLEALLPTILPIKKSDSLLRELKNVLMSHDSFKDLDTFLPPKADKVNPSPRDLGDGLEFMTRHLQSVNKTKREVNKEQKIKM